MKNTLKKILFYIFNKIFYPRINLSKNPISFIRIFTMGFMQKILGFNRSVPWPVHFTSMVNGHQNIIREEGASFPGYMPGAYIQASSKVYIGSKTRIGPGVKIISQNHDVYDIDTHLDSNPIKIGDNCWISANVVILPEVELGNYTIVAAGAVVNKSFKDGYCIVGGVPAEVIKILDKGKMK